MSRDTAAPHADQANARTLGTATLTGLPLAASAVPDGMASAAMAGVNPIFGLYGALVGPIVGGLTARSKLMVVTTTSAASLAAFSAVANVGHRDRPQAMALVTLLAGALMIAAGLLRLGRYVEFVSRSVMTGFLTGVAVSIILGQLSSLTGYDGRGDTTLLRAIDVVLHPGRLDWPTVVLGLAGLAMLALGSRSPVRNFAALGVLIVLSGLVWAVKWFDPVALVADAGQITPGLPPLEWPRFDRISLDVIGGAASVAAIVLVQGAGVSRAAPNPTGPPASVDGDFRAQGFANVAGAFVQAIPVGGSLGATSMSTSMGSRTRWVAVMSGVWMLAVLVALPDLVGKVAMPALAAILISAGVQSINRPRIAAVWRSGGASRAAMLVTFVGVLTLPIAAAVGLGVALSFVLALGLEAQDLRIVQVVEQAGRLVEQPVPAQLTSDSTVVLIVYGSLFSAGAQRAEAQLPRIAGARNARVIIRVRARERLGATAMGMIEKYADDLHAHGGRLILSGVGPALLEQLRRAHRSGDNTHVELTMATPMLGQATLSALEDLDVKVAADIEAKWRPSRIRRSLSTTPGDESQDQRTADPGDS